MASGVLYVVHGLVLLQPKGQNSSNGHHTIAVLFLHLFEFIFPSRNALLEIDLTAGGHKPGPRWHILKLQA